MSKKLVLFTAFTMCLALCGVTMAQEITGNIDGSVKDSNGAAVPGASVTIMDTTKRLVVRKVTTNSDGEYSAPNLPVSTYSVSAEAPNFKKSVQTGIALDV